VSGEPDKQRAPYWIAASAVLTGFAAGVFVTLLAELVGSAFGSPTTSPTPAVNITADFLFDGAFVASALYFARITRSFDRADFGYRRIPWRLGVGALLVAAVVYYGATLLYSDLLALHGTDTLPGDMGVKQSVWAAAFVALFVCVAAPVAEEFFFRGFLFGLLSRMRVRVGGRELGPWIAAVLVGLFFGLAHYDSAQPQFLVPLGFLGFVLCIVRWRTRSLYPCMALHSINNCVALGVNELHLGAAAIAALTAGSLALIALLTGPLAQRREGAAAAAAAPSGGR
jgi:membrane protease YdiL (CAAX protease family)